MAIVKTDVPYTSALCGETIQKLLEQYPFCRSEILTLTEFGRAMRTLVIGNGPRKVIYTAAHHANEWITTPILLKFCEDWADAIVSDGEIFGTPARELAEHATVYMVPMVDPDGVDLVTGAIPEDSPEYHRVGIDLEVFQAFAQGFLEKTRNTMTALELDTLADSCVCLTAELVVRFLDDYLRGDLYFKTDYPEHNLVRTRNQIALCRDMIAHLDEMHAIIRRCAQD